MHLFTGEHVLDEVGEVCFLSLRSLKIINITRIPFSMLAASSFVNLRCLVISPHNLGDDLVERIGVLTLRFIVKPWPQTLGPQTQKPKTKGP